MSMSMDGHYLSPSFSLTKLHNTYASVLCGHRVLTAVALCKDACAEHQRRSLNEHSCEENFLPRVAIVQPFRSFMHVIHWICTTDHCAHIIY